MDLPRLMVSLPVSDLTQPLGMLQGEGEIFSFSCLMAITGGRCHLKPKLAGQQLLDLLLLVNAECIKLAVCHLKDDLLLNHQNLLGESVCS